MVADQDERSTTIGNHLAQHSELSLTAVGLGVYIQSLPEGTNISVKALSWRLREGEYRIAKALRELERHGYLARNRERLPDGRIVTRTYWYSLPLALCENPPPALMEHPELPDGAPGPGCTSAAPVPDAAAGPAREELPAADAEPAPEPQPAPTPEAAPAPGTAPAAESASEQDRMRGQAWKLLAGLRGSDPRLTLSFSDIHRLAPQVTRWLENGARPSAVSRTLTAGLPEDLRHPAGLLAHRLATHLAPPLPAATPSPAPDPQRPHPMATCDGCERGFRAPYPGARCRDCGPIEGKAA
ncbi:helix-turn-helix domain-containing protein [Streptomyces sp. NPDC089799]|uniref:helix-turn-helix domain-containing protein n=1 Tax=Streptomyces sp. NPDC089799 TaxID=3155066 RepID=UPI003449E50C